jgi:2-dehydro-3-deoxygalactonokinase
MSGEVFALFRQHSILARTLPAEEAQLDEEAFLRGVRYAQQARSVLRSAFSARTLALFERMPADSLASYLSGLVIGEELRAHGEVEQSVVLIGSEALTARYELAFRVLGTGARRLGSEAAWRGLWALATTLEPA